MLCKLKGAGHCTSAKRMTSILRHVAEAFPSARHGKILNSHRVIGIATSTSVVLNCAIVTYIMMTAYVGLPGSKTVARLLYLKAGLLVVRHPSIYRTTMASNTPYQN